MYNNEPVPMGPRPEGALLNVAARFEALNLRQQSLINAIQEKVHQILDRRVPADKANGPAPGAVDFTSAMHRNLDTMETNSIALDNLLTQLNELV